MALQAAGLTLKSSKIAFGPKSNEYLAHVISAEGITVGKDRITAIQSYRSPPALKIFAQYSDRCGEFCPEFHSRLCRGHHAFSGVNSRRVHHYIPY